MKKKRLLSLLLALTLLLCACGAAKTPLEQTAAYLCADCLEEIAGPGASAVGVVNLKTRELRLFQARNSGFTLGDYYVAYRLEQGFISFLAIYCPPRDSAES